MSPARNFHFCSRGKLKFIHGRTVVQIVRSIKSIPPRSYGKTFRYRNTYLKISIESIVVDILNSPFAAKAYYTPIGDSFTKTYLPYRDFAAWISAVRDSNNNK